MTEAESEHSTPGRFRPKIIGGSDCSPDHHPAALSAAGSNGRLRRERDKTWRKAETATDYWGARLRLHDVISRAQCNGIEEGRAHREVTAEDRWPLLEEYHAAIAKQLLTPAPDARAVKWKQTELAKGQYRYSGVKPGQLEQSIADDLAWLAAHPARRDHAEVQARRRAFREAMRQRIRDIAASRDLSDDDIKPALSLRHQLIGAFAEKYGVNLEWLLDGSGRIFKLDPPVLI